MKIIYDNSSKNPDARVKVYDDENNEIDVAFYFNFKILFSREVLEIGNWEKTNKKERSENDERSRIAYKKWNTEKTKTQKLIKNEN